MSKDGTNTIVNKLIEKIPHPCKYSQFGCQIKLLLTEIIEHEASCSEKTIKCPYFGCQENVRMKEYHEHAMKSFCCDTTSKVKNGRFRMLLIVTPDLQPPANLMRWKMKVFEDHGKRFYLQSHYIPEVQAFALFISIAEHANEAKKYLAKLTCENPNNERDFVTVTKNVISMESAPSDQDSLMDSDSEAVMFVSWIGVRGYLKWTDETKDGGITYIAELHNRVKIIVK